MKVYKCDNCGMFFENNKTSLVTLNATMKENDFYKDYSIDLCENCLIHTGIIPIIFKIKQAL